MEEKIKEVQDYFKSKILAGEFELLSTDEWHCEIEIDKKCVFTFWMANGKNFFSQPPHEIQFMVLNLEKTGELFSIINKVWKEDRTLKAQAETEAKIKELQDQLKTLKSK